MSTTTVDTEKLNARFRAVVGLINKQNKTHADAHARVANHIRAVTNGRQANIGCYHGDASVPYEEKMAQYALVASALGFVAPVKEGDKPAFTTPDWSKLQGTIGQGSKTVEPEVPVPTAEPAAAEPAAPEWREIKPPESVTPRAVTPATASSGDLGRLLADAIAQYIPKQTAPTVDENLVRLLIAESLEALDLHDKIKAANNNGAFPTDRIEKLIADKLAGNVHRIELVLPDGSTKPVTGLVHRDFETVLKMTSSRVASSGHPVPVWLDGPPGGGKSHLMEQVAEALGLEAHILAIGPSDTKSAIVGSVATGVFKPGIAYEPYKNGGVLGIDEIAAGDPGVLVSTNSLVAQSSYRFPNGELVKKHKDFHLIAADNTRGHGNVKGMIRNRLDAATLDRFAFLKVGYDEKLEAALCGNPQWAAYVKQVRDYIASNTAESVYITPRASINGAALLAGGLDAKLVADATVFKFCSEDLKKTITSAIGNYAH